MNFKTGVMVITGLGLSILAGCSRGREEDPRGVLAALAGRMAADNDLREVRFADLNGDGQREVILVFGPRELLNFDVYYKGKGEAWELTPMVNDQNNPREFVSTSLDSVRDTGADGIPEISVSSRLYDGNTMVKELHWHANGYEVVSQRTVLASANAARSAPAETRQTAPAAAAAQSAGKSVEEAKPAAPAKEEVKPKPKPIPPERPSQGTYQVRKGDTIIGIARAIGISTEALESLNGNQLASRGLQIGQRIVVPVPRGKKENVRVRIEKERYEVKKGDSLSSIAKQYGVTVRALKSWNHDIPVDGNIQLGETIVIHLAVVDFSS